MLVYQRLIIRFFLNIFYTPIWWYSKGTIRAFKFCRHLLAVGNKNLVPILWLKNIFVPMFGQNDWQGKIVSFFVRLANVVGRSLALLIWFFIVVLLLLVWLFLPVFVVTMLILSIASI